MPLRPADNVAMAAGRWMRFAGGCTVKILECWLHGPKRKSSDGPNARPSPARLVGGRRPILPRRARLPGRSPPQLVLGERTSWKLT